MTEVNDILVPIELHDAVAISKCFAEGVDPNALFNNAPLIYELIGEYTRSPAFKDCVQAFVDAGLRFQDKALLAVLTDDVKALHEQLQLNPGLVQKSYTLRCAYTPLYSVTLLHCCAEFNHTRCGRLLLENGADVNAVAGLDDYGLGGHTPVFHTVNQNQHQSAQMMELLLEYGADLTITVQGFIWGKGYEWETFIPAVNPVSYAMMGLLPQMHRHEATTAKVVSRLMSHAFGMEITMPNIPNKYLQH